MIATDSPCLTHDQLQELAAGRLPGDRFTRLLEHLDACPDCQERAEGVETSEDSLVAALASPPAPDPHAAEADCVAALHACSQQRQYPAESSTPPVDQLGPYRLIRPLGSGGMGAVFLARHSRLRRQCAIKLLPRHRGLDALWRERFDREMAAVAALNDPHVVAASDAGESGGWHYLVMEYLDGLDLSRLAGRMGPVAVADACELVRQAAVGLAHVHSAGLVHRDIKPSNLMLTREGVVKILDLGLVLSDHDPLPADDRLTTVGQLMGTLAYMAPEQLADSTAVDHRADLYALGATLYRLLAGTPPHGSARGIAPLVLAKTRHPAPDLGQLRSDVPAPLAAFVRGMLDRDPERRPQSAAAVVDALQRQAGGADPKRLVAAALRKRPAPEESSSDAPIPLPASGAVSPPRRPWRGKRWLAAAAALPLLLLAGIALVISTDRGQLVIESDAAGLDLSVQRGDEVVEQLQLSTGENRITLRSGTYTVTLDAEADGLELSDQTATVTRGGETVLRVRREPAPAATSVAEANDVGPRYRGQTFSHWLAVLETERDVETIIDAMKAVVELSRGDGASNGEASQADDSRQAEAAGAMLRAARRFGGMTSSGIGSMRSGLESPSARFMGHLLALYPALLPNPGLNEISKELADGNEASSMAAIWLLSTYANGWVYDDLYQPDFRGLERWSETDEGRVGLRELSDHLDHAVQRLGGYETPSPELEHIPSADVATSQSRAIGMAYQTRLRLNELLDVDSFQDPGIADRLRRSIENMVSYSQQRFAQVGGAEEPAVALRGPQPLSEWEVQAALDKMGAAVVTWAAMPTLLPSHFQDPQGALNLLRRLGSEAPEPTADALLTMLYHHRVQIAGTRMEGYGAGGGMAGEYVPRIAISSYNEALVRHAVELIGPFTSKPEAALSVLREMRDEMNEAPENLPQFSELRNALQSAIEALEARVEGRDSPVR